jgi:hypothetical protein
MVSQAMDARFSRHSAALMEACLVATESHSERADPVGGLAKLLTSLVTVAHQPQSNGSPNRTG